MIFPTRADVEKDVDTIGDRDTTIAHLVEQDRVPVTWATEAVDRVLGSTGSDPWAAAGYEDPGVLAGPEDVSAAPGADVAELLPEATCPEHYRIRADGVFAERSGRNGDPALVRVTWAPLVSVGIYTDPAGDQLVELAWHDGRGWVRRLVPRSVAKSGRKLPPGGQASDSKRAATFPKTVG